MSNHETYDIAIIGTGFAGYTAGIYASRYKMKNVIFGDIFGGQTAEAHKVCNYPGIEEISGLELMNRVRKQAKNLGTQEIMERIDRVEWQPATDIFKLISNSGTEYFAKYVLLTVGIKKRKLNAPGEERLAGKGISYCATCDGFFFKGKRIAIIGGGDAATTAALYLSNIAEHVTMLVRGPKLKGETVWIDQVLSMPNISVHFNTQVSEFVGETRLEKIKTTGEIEELTVEGAFIEIGSEPNREFLAQFGAEQDETGHLIVDKRQSTTIPKLFAAGDVTTNSNKFEQLVTAAGEASVAVNSIFEDLQLSK